MHVLAFDHFFDQDLSALDAALDVGDTLTRIDYQRLHRVARRCFPAEAFTGVAAAYSADYRDAWARYVPKAEAFADWMVAAHEPDVFVVPTDAIFYLRPMISRLRAAGVRTVVMQKETTISPMVMDRHAREVGTHVPFMSDVMTVCSDRQRKFWVRAGADPARIVVTGQPRFDVYAQQRDRRDGVRRTVLYLSFDDVAYLPGDLGDTGGPTWRDMRRDIETLLAEAATAGWEVAVKHHPQQPTQEEWLGQRVQRHPRRADTRALLGSADVVVGFQTTALFEAAASGAVVLYCAWGPVFDAHQEDLIPFHELVGIARHVTSADELRALLGPDGNLTAVDAVDDRQIVAHLGPVDGRAAERAVAVIRQHAGDVALTVRCPRRAVLLGGLQGILGHALALGGRALTAAGRDSGRRASSLADQWRSAGREAAAVRRTRLSGAGRH